MYSTCQQSSKGKYLNSQDTVSDYYIPIQMFQSGNYNGWEINIITLSIVKIMANKIT